MPGGCGLKSDIELLANAAKLFLGTHDFSAFGSPTTPKGTTVRTVMKAEWMQAGKDEWHFEVQADAFLYRMVRRLVFVQVAVAQGKVSAEAIARSLAKPASAGIAKRNPCGISSRTWADASRSDISTCRIVNWSIRKETENQKVYKSYYPKASEIERNWVLVDADGQNPWPDRHTDCACPAWQT